MDGWLCVCVYVDVCMCMCMQCMYVNRIGDPKNRKNREARKKLGTQEPRNQVIGSTVCLVKRAVHTTRSTAGEGFQK